MHIQLKRILPLLLMALPLALMADGLDPDDPQEPVRTVFTCGGLQYLVDPSAPTTVAVIPRDDRYNDPTVRIPSTVTDPGTGTAYTVAAIAQDAFVYGQLTTLAIPASVTKIAPDAFYYSSIGTFEVDHANPCFTTLDGHLYDKALTSLLCYTPGRAYEPFTLPATVTTLGDYCFAGLAMTAYDFPEQITAIGRGAFQGTRLRSVAIPERVTQLGGDAFSGCTSLTDLSLPHTITEIPDHLVARCYMLKSISYSDQITAIGDYAFDGAFAYGAMMSLPTGFVIPDKVTYVGVGAFNACRGLKSVTIGKSVATIDLFAFSSCSGLTEVTSLNPQPPFCPDFDGLSDVAACFNEVPEACVLKVPENAVEAYTSAWGAKFADIRGVPSQSVVETVAAAPKRMAISVAGGQITVDTLRAATIYNPAGVAVRTLPEGKSQCTLAAGVYIVTDGRESVKLTLTD